MAHLNQNSAYAQLNYEHPAAGVIQEWTADRSLCIFVIANSRPETIDAWAVCAKQALFRWNENTPCFLLHDLRKAGRLTFNSQLQFRFAELYRYRPSLPRFVAVALSTNADTYRFAQLSIKVRELMAPSGYAAHWDVFTSRLDALNWLLRLRLEYQQIDN